VFYLDEETLDVWREEEFIDEGRTLVRRRLQDGTSFDSEALLQLSGV
jgi:hypothetical protein